ncbi:MAG: GAP family protein [Ilumatobacteraceae bacterium]
MWPLIGALLVLGLSANEPSALLVVLVVLRSGRDRGVAFVAGWVTSLCVVVAGAGFIVRLGLGPRRGGPRRVTLVIELVIGVALMAWSAWYWLHSRGRAKSVEVPKYLARLTSIRRMPAFFAGMIACTYPPAIVAGTTLLRSHASTTGRVAGMATFVIVGTLMVALPVVGMYVSPVWAAGHSDRLFNWTLRHRRTLLITIVIVLGLFISVRAILHLTHVRHN